MFHFYCFFMCRCSMVCFFVIVDILHPPVDVCCRYFTILFSRLIFYILLFSMLYIIHFLLCVVDNHLLFFPMLEMIHLLIYFVDNYILLLLYVVDNHILFLLYILDISHSTSAYCRHSKFTPSYCRHSTFYSFLL